VWVDKGIYLWKGTTEHLRRHTKCLVHYTPDTAFYANRSRHFFAAAKYYDLLVTTKSFELEKYTGIVEANRVYLTTQAYDAKLHRQPEHRVKKHSTVVFIGLCEADREDCIEAILAAGVSVRLGGKGWERFVKRNADNPYLHYLGDEIFGEEYVSEYCSASIGLGLLSKRFPELHTTRTFEIPACGTLLATEKTADTERFFEDEEVLFFKDYEELSHRLVTLLKNLRKIEEMSIRGHNRVINGNYDYAAVLSGVLSHLSLHP